MASLAAADGQRKSARTRLSVASAAPGQAVPELNASGLTRLGDATRQALPLDDRPRLLAWLSARRRAEERCRGEATPRRGRPLERQGRGWSSTLVATISPLPEKNWVPSAR
jgi:hypothetical protein